MTREEEIQKAAVECAEKIDKKYSYKNTELPYVVAIDAFKDGAYYVDKHPAKKQTIWHNANETPSENSKIVIIDMYGNWYNISYSFDDYDDCFGKGWESCVRAYTINNWAYLDDLTNL